MSFMAGYRPTPRRVALGHRYRDDDMSSAVAVRVLWAVATGLVLLLAALWGAL